MGAPLPKKDGTGKGWVGGEEEGQLFKDACFSS